MTTNNNNDDNINVHETTCNAPIPPITQQPTWRIGGEELVVTDYHCMTARQSMAAASPPPLLHWGGEDDMMTMTQTTPIPPITQQPTRNVGNNDNASAPMAGRRGGGRGISVASVLKRYIPSWKVRIILLLFACSIKAMPCCAIVPCQAVVHLHPPCCHAYHQSCHQVYSLNLGKLDCVIV